MECKQCGYNLKEGDMYCPNCGKEVKVEGVECHHCHYIMEEDCNFCPQCGKEVTKQNNHCAQCGYEMTEEAIFCPNCGKKKGDINIEQTPDKKTVVIEKPTVEKASVVKQTGYVPIQKQENAYVKETVKEYMTVQKKEPIETTDTVIEVTSTQTKQQVGVSQPGQQSKVVNKDTFWRNPILWIISISLLIICLLLSQYMKDNPSSSNSAKKPDTEDKIEEELQDVGITKDTSNFIMQANTNVGGTTYRYGANIYISVDDAIYELNLEFGDEKKVVDEAGDYIYVDKTYIYYCDENYTYQRVHRETNKKEKVLENIYYARVIDGMLYYQADSDGESIHVYNLQTKEDRKINSEKSYSMVVDTKNNVIYYLNGNNALCKINIDGTGSEVLLDKHIASFVYEEGSIYYSEQQGVTVLDLATKKETLLLEETNAVYVSLLEDKIVYGSYNVGLYTMNKDGSKKKVITTNYIQGFEVHGDVVIYSDATKGAIYGADKDANRTRIHKIKYEDSYNKESSPNIDGIQEF